MILIDALEIIEKHNKWRRGDDSVQGNPTEIGIAMDIVILAAARYEEVRKWNANTFVEIYRQNITTGQSFDEIVDERIKARAEA